MNARIGKLIQLFFSARPALAPADSSRDAGNLAEADYLLYGDGMGWTCIPACLSCDEEGGLKPACCTA